MNPIDRSVAQFFNQSIAWSETFDRALREIAFNDAFKGFLAVGIVLWALARGTEPFQRLRVARAMAGAFALVLALAFNRLLASVLPFVPRPLHDPELGLRVPLGLSARTLGDLSSFPSDHAVLFGGLATLSACLSGRFGILAWAHALIVVLLPRLWLGLHWISDLAVGIGLGAGAVLLVERRHGLASWLLRREAWLGRYAGFSALAAYALIYALVTLFDPFVRVARWVVSLWS